MHSPLVAFAVSVTSSLGYGSRAIVSADASPGARQGRRWFSGSTIARGSSSSTSKPVPVGGALNSSRL